MRKFIRRVRLWIACRAIPAEVVLFGAGDWHLAGPITLTKGQQVWGVGPTTTRRRHDVTIRGAAK